MRPIEILLVEDNPGDARLTQEALSMSKIHNNLHHARDGEEAMRFLRRQDVFAEAPTPDLILPDRNFAEAATAREVLDDIKKDPLLMHVPVQILTTSQAEEDILRAYRLHANCFITKPVDLEQFIKVVRSIEQFWFTIVKLPET